MKKNLLIILFFTVSLFAEMHSKQELLKMNNEGYKIKSWYMKIGMGYPYIKHTDSMETTINKLKTQSAISKNQSAIDIGVFTPLNNNYVLGFNVNAHRDNLRFTDSQLANFTIQINNYAISNLYYLNSIADGIFFRGDIGLAKGVSKVNEAGIGLAFGIGYSFYLDDISMQFEGLVTKYQMANEHTSSNQILLSILF